MMYDMIIPEEIYLMAPAMYPVSLEIDDKKSNDISKNGCFNMNDRNMIHQPAIGDDGNPNAKNIFYDVGHAAAKTGNTIQPADNIGAFFPFHNLFN